MLIKAITDTSVIGDKTTFNSVVLTAVNGVYYPYCKLHGAMNKVSVFDNKGNAGFWRCLHYTCRAGCEQLNSN